MISIKRKELNDCVNDVRKTIHKEYGYKIRSGTLYREMEGYFVSVHVYGTGMENNIIHIWATIKPMFFDDVFWDVFKMSENKKEPLSLRAVGAFSVRGLDFFDQKITVEDYDEIPKYIRNLVEKCNQELNELIKTISLDYGEFISLANRTENKGMYEAALGEMLYNIYNGQFLTAYNIAAEEIANHRRGYFQNLGKDIYEHVIDYCRDKMGE